MKKMIIAAIMVGSLFLVGCSVNPSELSDGYVRNFARTTKYVKDERTGICFAVVASRATGGLTSTGVAMATVPCEKVGSMLVK